MLDRREFLKAGLLGAAGAGLPRLRASAAASRSGPVPRLTKILDIGPGGVISPGSAQDLRYAGNRGHYHATRTPWIRMWADWPSLQPHPGFAPDDRRSPGFWKLQALDAQVRLARASGLRVMLMPYRFPTWVNGTAALSARKGSEAEISFRFADRMGRADWERYVRTGREPEGRSALEYLLPDDPYGPASEWARFFDFLYGRYHGRVDGFELVNEPNLQLWPQQAAPPAGAEDPFTQTRTTIEREIVQLLKTAQAISASYAHSTMLFAPSISDSDAETSRLYTRWDRFVPALLDAFGEFGYLPHSRQAWSHHNYTDVERRQTTTRTQLIRGLLAGRWAGHDGGRPPTVFITEGGARLSRMPALYPGEDPREAQAACLRHAWALHQPGAPAGDGVAMLAQYLIYADPNFDCGLIDPYPSTVERPAYAAWSSFDV